MPQGDWLFWMDSDDTIPPECGRKLRDLVERDVDPQGAGLRDAGPLPGRRRGRRARVATSRSSTTSSCSATGRTCGSTGGFTSRSCRRSAAAGGEVAWTDVYVVHSGSDQSPPAQEKKLQRDLRLLELELAERPEHPFTLFNLGMTSRCMDRGFAEAVDYLRRGHRAVQPGRSRTCEGVMRCWSMPRCGWAVARRRWRPAGEAGGCSRDDAELRFREGVLLHELGRLDEARRAYLDVLGTATSGISAAWIAD